MCSTCADTKGSEKTFSWLALGGFGFLWASTLTKLLLQSKSEQGSLHYSVCFVAFHILSISLLNTFLAVEFDWGGTCVSSVGATTQLLMWPEWISTVPLLVYLTIAVVDKPLFSAADLAFIGTMFLCLLIGSMMQFSQSSWSGWILFVISTCLYLPMLFLPAFLMHGISESEAGIKDSMARQNFALRSKRRHQLAKWLIFGSAIFPVLYFLSALGYLNSAQSVEALHMFSVIIKGFFTTVVTDVHMDLVVGVEELALAEEKRASKARREFMKSEPLIKKIPLIFFNLYLFLNILSSFRFLAVLFPYLFLLLLFLFYVGPFLS